MKLPHDHGIELDVPAEELVRRLLALPAESGLCLLDSSGVGHLGSHLLIAGFDPVHREESDSGPPAAVQRLSEIVDGTGLLRVFTLSYDLGNRLLTGNDRTVPNEPLVFAAVFDAAVVHDYETSRTTIYGPRTRVEAAAEAVLRARPLEDVEPGGKGSFVSNFSKAGYMNAVREIHEHIRRGDTYQTNLTQQITVQPAPELTAEQVFLRLRREHPAPFAAFIRRADSTVVSASPERFLKIEDGTISSSPIKGTRPRGEDREEDDRLRAELASSKKDRAENIMITDLLRNDLGRVCEYGSVTVDDLCDIEEHPTIFHLVSTIRGSLRPGTGFADILQAAFPCGSITGAPKIRTMEIINEVETVPRGLSMGAIGYASRGPAGADGLALDSSVAIRTIVFRGSEAVFNVGGGVVIDSDPEKEYEEAMLKAKALLRALGCDQG